MAAVIQLGDATATIDNGVWRSDDAALLQEVLSFNQDTIPSGHGPTYDEAIARHIATMIGADFVRATPATNAELQREQ